jgi:small-conductance mechanosensitive channel
LRVSVPDIGKAVGVQSALRIAIFKALRAADIEIPFNQIDVNLRDLDGVKRYLSQLAELQPTGKDGRQAAQATATDRGNGKRVTTTGD